MSSPPFRVVLILLRAFYFTLSGHAQQAEIPGILNFLKEEYQGQKLSWQIGQLGNGLMPYANTSGLILYDGVSWRLFQMPHQQIFRTLLVDQSRIYYNLNQLRKDTPIMVYCRGHLCFFADEALRL